MALSPVAHTVIALNRLLYGFQGADQPNIQAIISTLSAQAEELEAMFLDLCSETIDTAVGAQLDGLGRVVGELRLGRSDVDYRAAIQSRIVINKGNATIEDILFVMGSVLPAGFPMQLTEPADATVWVDFLQALTASEPSGEVLASLLDRASGAGIGHAVFFGGFPAAERFTFAPGLVPVADTDLGYGDVAQTIGGRYSGVAV